MKFEWEWVRGKFTGKRVRETGGNGVYHVKKHSLSGFSLTLCVYRKMCGNVWGKIHKEEKTNSCKFLRVEVAVTSYFTPDSFFSLTFPRLFTHPKMVTSGVSTFNSRS